MMSSSTGPVAEIAGQHRVDLRQNAERGDPLEQLGNLRRRNRRAPPAPVPGVVRERDRVERPGLDPETLQRKNRRGVADMAIGDARLDRQHGSASTLMIAGAALAYIEDVLEIEEYGG